MEVLAQLARTFDPQSGLIEGAVVSTRRLSDLQGVFADEPAYQAACARGNPVIYTVASVESATGDGQLHYGLGTLMPGKIGAEYYCTRGHLHAWRPAAEVYIGLQGDGAMLLEDEQTGATRLEPLGAGCIVYVPGFTAHRTVNTGDRPLVYLGVYAAAAGHDYGAIAERNFRALVVAQEGRPTLVRRDTYLGQIIN
jgi:glucose-6-phosphate isomerase